MRSNAAASIFWSKRAEGPAIVTTYTETFRLKTHEMVVTPFRLSSKFENQPLFRPDSMSFLRSTADFIVFFVNGTSFVDLRKFASVRSSSVLKSAFPPEVA